MLPNRAITMAACCRGMWMIWLTSRLNVKPSVDRAVIVDRFASSAWDSVLASAQFSTTLAVGTISTLWVCVLIGYLPGSSGTLARASTSCRSSGLTITCLRPESSARTNASTPSRVLMALSSAAAFHFSRPGAVSRSANWPISLQPGQLIVSV